MRPEVPRAADEQVHPTGTRRSLAGNDRDATGKEDLEKGWPPAGSTQGSASVSLTPRTRKKRAEGNSCCHRKSASQAKAQERCPTPC